MFGEHHRDKLLSRREKRSPDDVHADHAMFDPLKICPDVPCTTHGDLAANHEGKTMNEKQQPETATDRAADPPGDGDATAKAQTAGQITIGILTGQDAIGSNTLDRVGVELDALVVGTNNVRLRTLSRVLRDIAFQLEQIDRLQPDANTKQGVGVTRLQPFESEG
jgi:hypothetical protein